MLLRDFTRRKRKGGKLDHKWRGPYEITRVLGKGLYSLKDVNTHQIIERVNGYHLKEYHMASSMSNQVGKDILDAEICIYVCLRYNTLITSNVSKIYSLLYNH